MLPNSKVSESVPSFRVKAAKPIFSQVLNGHPSLEKNSPGEYHIAKFDKDEIKNYWEKSTENKIVRPGPDPYDPKHEYKKNERCC